MDVSPPVGTSIQAAKPYQVLARKYRPQTFAELIGQEHVRTTLENAVTQGRTAHGYIFSGQRGTGKTTVARILARCLNCDQGPTIQPCLRCAPCLEIAAGNCVDVIEIDAASNRGINEMRELRENVKYRPARDRSKVFIIDEAHQITSEAFNALLKTLEEPPEWVVFMLCTTEAHKIPATIASRCQQFSFRSVEFAELVSLLERICAEEGISSDPEALAVIAQSGEGSVRDSLSALDQAIACCGASLSAAEVRKLLGLYSLDTLGEVIRALDQGDSRRMLEIVQELERNGHNLQHFCRELARYFRNLLVVRVAGAGTRLVAASKAEQESLRDASQKFREEDLTRFLQLTLDNYRELQYSLQPRLHLEIGLLRLIHAGRLQPIEEAIASLGNPPAPGGPNEPPRGPAPRSTPGHARGSATAPAASEPAQSLIRPALGPESGLRDRLLAALIDRGQKFLADAVAHAEAEESGNEVRFRAPREYAVTFRSSEFKKAVDELRGRPTKITFAEARNAVDPQAAAPAEAEEEARQRALTHPEVQRFQQAFPGSQVRTVRNLKE